MKSPSHRFTTMLVVTIHFILISYCIHVSAYLGFKLFFLHFFFIERTQTTLNKIWEKNKNASHPHRYLHSGSHFI